MIQVAFASAPVQARIGDHFFDTLEEAIEFSTSKDTISLTTNVSLNKTLEIHKTVNIDLNGFDIKSNQKVFLIQGGSLNLSGHGKIIETKPYYGAITMMGSTDSSKKDFSTISIGKDITLQGWSGIFIDHNNKSGYGILVNMNGKINAVDDIQGGPGAGIYVNGNIQHKDNSPIINLSNSVKITSTGNGIYSAGYATYNINGSHISGEESGLGIKSGIFNIIDATIIGSGEDKTPTTGNNNGINPSGAAIQMESNAKYAGNIELYIKNGIFQSKNSNVIYEYTVNNNPTQIKTISFSGGKYTSEKNKNVFSMSDSFNDTHKKFISGGQYSSNPTNYLKSGYSTSKNSNSMYEVITSTISVFSLYTKTKTSPIPIIIIFLCCFGVFVYFKHKKY